MKKYVLKYVSADTSTVTSKMESFAKIVNGEKYMMIGCFFQQVLRQNMSWLLGLLENHELCRMNNVKMKTLDNYISINFR